jgi:hypothetical protein
MLVYTIAENATYSVDEYDYRYAESFTDKITSVIFNCGPGEAPKTVHNQSHYYQTTVQQFHDGAIYYETRRYYNNDAPAYIPESICNIEGSTFKIGGYTRDYKLEILGFTYSLSNGQLTEYNETANDFNDGYGNFRFSVLRTLKKCNTPWETNGFTSDTTTTTYNSNCATTIEAKTSVKSSFVLENTSLKLTDLILKSQEVIYELKETTITTTTNIEANVIRGKSGTYTTFNPYLSEQPKTRETFSRSSPSVDFNLADTVISITDHNILWYKIKDDGKNVQFTNVFSSISSIGKQITISYNRKPILKEIPIGSKICIPPDPPIITTKDLISKYTDANVLYYKNINGKFNGDFNGFPINTFIYTSPILLTTSIEKTLTHTSYTFKDVPNEELEDIDIYKTVLEKVNIGQLQFDRQYLKPGKIKDQKTYISSTYGECIKDGTTIYDYLAYTSIIKEEWATFNSENGGEYIFNKKYLHGQAAPNNLSICEQVVFKDGFSYNSINAANGAFLYPNVPLAFNNIGKYFTFFNNGKTNTAISPLSLNSTFNLKNLFVLSSTQTVATNKQTDSIIAITKHEFLTKGDAPNTFLTEYSINSYKSLLINQNDYCVLSQNSTGEYVIYKINCGIYCDNGKNTDIITRIIFPGSYLVIDINGTKNSLVNEVLVTTQNKSSYYYLPWNNNVIKTNGGIISSVSKSFDLSNLFPELGSMTAN